jgi:hypothetical protein
MGYINITLWYCGQTVAIPDPHVPGMKTGPSLATALVQKLNGGVDTTLEGEDKMIEDEEDSSDR